MHKFVHRKELLTLAFIVVLLVAVNSCVGITGADNSNRGLNVHAGSTDTITLQAFGMHIHQPALPGVGWPRIPFGTWRMWDCYVSWADLEPAPGQWNFQLLDQLVGLAEKRQVQINLVLALTPRWASARPMEPSNYGPGAAAEPQNINSWENYVRTVAGRYRGRIHYYELWNEPNDKHYFSGSISTLLALSEVAYTTLKQVDPTITVVSPAPYSPSWLNAYLAAGGGNYADIIAYHFYRFPGTPEALVPYFGIVKKVLADNNIHKPLWDTEIGWGPDQVFSSDAEMADFVARTVLLHFASGIEHLDWYAWDDRSHWLTLYLTQADRRTPNAAGLAFAEMQDWVVGTKATGCNSNPDGSWVCEFAQTNGSSRWAVWNPYAYSTFAVPGTWSVGQARSISGAMQPILGGRVQIGPSPVLLMP